MLRNCSESSRREFNEICNIALQNVVVSDVGFVLVQRLGDLLTLLLRYAAPTNSLYTQSRIKKKNEQMEVSVNTTWMSTQMPADVKC